MMTLLIAHQATSRLARVWYEGVPLFVVGMLVVFCALCLTAGAIALLNRFLGQDEILDRPRSSSTPPKRGSVEEDARLKVVLAAAAAVVVGRAVRVNRVTPVKG